MDMGNYKRGINSYKFKQYEYNSIYDVYNNIRKDSRVIFILRHAERGSDYSKEGGLLKNGIRQAKSLGKRLSGGNFADINSDFYGSTEYRRTYQTSYYVGCSRGYLPFIEDKKKSEEDSEKYDKVVHPIDVVGPGYLWYEMDFNELNRKCNSMIDKLCELTRGHPFSFITSHDNLLIPLITLVSEGIIKFTTKTWINYLSGVVIIINDITKKREIYPIQTLKSKSMVIEDAGNFKGVRCSISKRLK